MKSLHLEDSGVGYLENQSLIEELKQSKDTHRWLLDRLNEIEKYDLFDYYYNTKLLLHALEERWEVQRKILKFLWRWWGSLIQTPTK